MCYIRVMSDEKYIVPKREMYPSSVFNDELLKDALDPGVKLSKHLLCNAAFRTKPESNLVACLSSYTKNYLLELAKDHELNIAKSTRKDELVKTLSERIVERFPKMLPYLPKVNLEFLTRFNTENNILNIKVDELEFRDISHAHNFGFLFLYYDKKDFFAVVPVELLETLTLLKEGPIWQKVSLNQRLDAYAISLSNLYGVLDIDQFAIIWNRFEKEVLTAAMVQDELKELGKAQYYWWFDDELIISSFFDSFEEVELFLEKVKEVSYYTPSREELIAYFQTPYDENSPAISEMKSFLAGYQLPSEEEFDDLIDEISDSCIVGDQMQDVFNLLNEYGVLFNGMDEINRFTELYVQMCDNSRKWELRGHTPNALKERRTSR